MLRLLGAVQLRQADDWLEPALNKPFCLLAYLAYKESWVNRDQLAFLFWPDSDEQRAKRNLRQLISRIKKLDFATIDTEATRLRWQVATDVNAFRRAVVQQDWQAAHALYRGPLLSNLDARDTAGFETWLELERDSLQRSYLEASLSYAKQLEEVSSFGDASQVLQGLLQTDDLSEDVLQQYLRVTYLAGQRDTALDTFYSFQKRLAEELELEPLAETLELVELIQAATPMTVASAAAREARQPVPLSVLRPPKLVGRAAALAELTNSQAPLTLVAADAGAGKSRLLQEAAANARLLQCQEGLQQVAYYPVIQFIRECIKTGPAPDLGRYSYDIARLVPEAYPALKPPATELTESRLLEALSLFLEALKPAAPFHYQLEDLQWADPASLRLLTYLAQKQSLKLVASYRSFELSAPLAQTLQALGQLTQTVTLQPLSEQGVSELLAHLMQQDQGPPVFSAWLHRLSGGNPMFILEVLKSLFETEVLRADETGWHTRIDEITQDYTELDVPGAISELMQRRFSALSAETLRVLQAAAVAANDSQAGLLKQLTGLSDFAVLDALEEAEQKGIMQTERFVHDLSRQSLYQQLSASRKTFLHARVAELATDLEPAIRAEHWFSAGRYPEAITLWQEAARSYQRQGLFELVFPLLDRALTYATDDATVFDLKEQKLVALQRAGQNQQALDLADELEASGNTDVIAAALNTKAIILLRQGKTIGAQAAIDRCQALAKAIDDEGFHDSFLMTRVIGLHSQGAYQQVTELLEAALPDLRARGASDISTVLSSLAATYDTLGQHDKALSLHLEALERAKQEGDHYFQVDAALNLLYCYMDLGRTEEGLGAAEAALELGPFENSAALRSNVATAYFELGRFEAAKRHYQHVAEATEHGQLRALAYARLADCHDKLGQADVHTLLDKAYQALSATAAPIFKARVLLSTLKLGSEAQRERLYPLLGALDTDQLPAYLKDELQSLNQA